MTKPRLALLPVADLWVGPNIRDDVGDITSLAESIAAVGVLEPLVVWPSADRTHPEVGMGQRRLAAARLAGLDTVPCLLRDRPSTRDRVLMQLAENHERADMTPIDEAHAFTELIGLGISRRALAHAMHKNEEWIYRRLRLLDLPDRVQAAVHTGTVSPSAALEFPLMLADDADAMARFDAAVTVVNDDTLRGWIRGEYRRRGRQPGVKLERKGTRVIAVTIDAYELAHERARAEGRTLGEWATTAIARYAEERRRAS